MTDKQLLEQALKRAFQLGQNYWSWADSEYSSHWKKADAAKAEFDKLVEDTFYTTPPAAQPAPVQEPVQDSTCNETLRGQGKAYPRTCKKCGLGPCVGKPKAEAEKQETNQVTLTQTNVGIGERGMEAYEAAKKRGWVGVSDERLMEMPKQEPVAFNAGVPPLYPEMKDGETISVEYTTPPAAQPAPTLQEPVAWMHWLDGSCGVMTNKTDAMRELDRLNREYPADISRRAMRPLIFADTTPPQRTEQEPVAFPRQAGDSTWIIDTAFIWRVKHTIAPDTPYDWTPSEEQIETVLLALEKIPSPLYTTLPQRTWVGLDDTDIGNEYVRFEVTKGGFNRFEYAVRAIETKLKEKNNG